MSHFWTIREFVPAMLERNCGTVVPVSSMAGMVGTANLNDYCASKYAVVGLMESLSGQVYNEKKTYPILPFSVLFSSPYWCPLYGHLSLLY